MSQYSDHCNTLKEMIKKYPGSEDVVIDVFHNTISNQYWDDEDIRGFFKFAKGVSENADLELENFMANFLD